MFAYHVADSDMFRISLKISYYLNKIRTLIKTIKLKVTSNVIMDDKGITSPGRKLI